MSDLITIRKALDQLHRETCEEGGQNFAFSPAYLEAYAATNRLEADAQALADVRTLDDWAVSIRSVVSCTPVCKMNACWTVYVRAGVSFDGMTADAARAAAAAWVRSQQ